MSIRIFYLFLSQFWQFIFLEIWPLCLCCLFCWHKVVLHTFLQPFWCLYYGLWRCALFLPDLGNFVFSFFFRCFLKENFKLYNHSYSNFIDNKSLRPGWCGSVDWVPACEPKGCWFDSQSGHMPGLGPGPQLGACERPLIDVSPTHWCFSPSLFLPFPSL